MSEIWPRPRIRNEFVYELKDGLFDRASFLAFYDLNADISKPATHMVLAEHPLLQAVRDRYPFLSPRCDLFAVGPQQAWRGLHLDGTEQTKHTRLSAVNIPLYEPGTCHSDTEFWELLPGCHIQEYIDRTRNITTRGADPSKCVKRFVHQLNVPTIIDVQVPHTVRNHSSILRKVVSFSSSLPFPETVKAFK